MRISTMKLEHGLRFVEDDRCRILRFDLLREYPEVIVRQVNETLNGEKQC